MNAETLRAISGTEHWPKLTEPSQAYLVVEKLLSQKLVDHAHTLINMSLQLWPDDSKLRLIKGDVLFAVKSDDAALNHFITLLEIKNLQPWAIGRLSYGLATKQNVEGNSLSRLIDRVKDLEIEKKLLDRVFLSIIKCCSEKDKISLLKIITKTSDNYIFKWRYAVSLFDAGKFDLALAYLEGMHLNEPGTSFSLMLHANLLSTQGNFVKATELLERENNKDILDAHAYRLLISLKQVQMQFVEAGELLESCLAKWPEDWILIFRLNKSPLPEILFEKIFQNLSEYFDSYPLKYAELGYEFAITCLQAGAIGKAKKLLNEILTDPKCNAKARNLLEGLSKNNFSDSQFKNSRFKDDRCSDFQIVRSTKPSTTAIIVFAMNSINDWPLEMIDSTLESLNSHIIYLRDFQRKAFLGGVKSLGNSEKETIEKLHVVLNHLGIDNIITLGASFCGYAAFKYGATLQAKHAISYAGPNNLHTYYSDTPPSVWNYLYFIQLKTNRPEYVANDLLPLIVDSTATTFHQFYGGANSRDSIQAERLSALTNVLITKIQGVDDHAVVNQLIKDDTFVNYISKLI